MFIDSHCHLDKLDLTPYEGDFQAMLDAAYARQVSHMLCVSVDLEKFDDMYALIEPHDTIFASAGVHPLSASDWSVSRNALIEAAQREKVIAIGETGLDYFYDEASAEQQKESFKHHLEVAGELELPVIVHTRDARQDTLELIAKHGNPKSGGVLHCFTESWEMAEQAIEMGYYISFSGIVTFRNAEELREVVKRVPLERILIETDAPYLAPVPHRGKKNEPQYVVDVAQCVADVKGVSINEIASRTCKNFATLFKQGDLSGV